MRIKSYKLEIEQLHLMLLDNELTQAKKTLNQLINAKLTDKDFPSGESNLFFYFLFNDDYSQELGVKLELLEGSGFYSRRTYKFKQLEFQSVSIRENIWKTDSLPNNISKEAKSSYKGDTSENRDKAPNLESRIKQWEENSNKEIKKKEKPASRIIYGARDTMDITLLPTKRKVYDSDIQELIDLRIITKEEACAKLIKSKF